MGHFSYTCSVSGLAIRGGTSVRCLLLTASPYGDEDGVRNAWLVRTPPIRAVYNDYGTIEKIHKDDKFIADLWLRGFREDLIERGVGDNSYHDLPTAKDMTMEQLLDALRSGRVEVRQEAKMFWRRPLPSDDTFEERKETPFFKQIGDLLMKIGTVAKNGEEREDAYVVDEPVPNLVRVRFGRYQHGEKLAERLDRAKAVVEEAGFAAVVTAGSGRYPDEADLLVMYRPKKDQHFKGAHWDMASGKSSDDKRLSVRLAMVREDVWQALVEYPRSTLVVKDCLNCGQSSLYHEKGNKCPSKSINNKPFKKHEKDSIFARDPVFPKGVEHVIVPYDRFGEGGSEGEYVWFGLAAFKADIRRAWKAVLDYFTRQERLERNEEAEDDEDEDDKKLNPELEKLLAGFEAGRKAEQERIAKLPQEERDRLRAEQKAQQERWEEAKRERLANPIFGDYLLSDYSLKLHYDDAGSWILRPGTPGVIGISEHLSMCLADKKEVPTFVIDRLAELAIFTIAMREVGCIWKPGASTGPQDPEWKEHVRFQETLARIARQEDAKQRDGEAYDLLPSTLGEAIEKFKGKSK